MNTTFRYDRSMYKGPTSVSIPTSLAYKRKAQHGRGIKRHKKRKRYLKLKKRKKIKIKKKNQKKEQKIAISIPTPS